MIPLTAMEVVMGKLVGLVKHFVPAKKRVREEVKAKGEGQLALGENSLQLWRERLGWSEDSARYLASAVALGIRENVAAVLDKAQRLHDSGDFEGEFTKRLIKDPTVIGPVIEASKFVSNEELRDLLGRLLNEDVSRPGSVSKQTVSVAQDLTPLDLQEFLKLRAVFWRVQATDLEECFVVVGPRVSMFGAESISFDPENIGIDYHTFGEFQQLGLLQERFGGALFRPTGYDECDLICSQRIAKVRLNENESEGEGRLPVGMHVLTKAGTEIINLFLDEDFPPLEGYFEEVCDHWRSQGHEVSEVVEDAEKR